MTKLIFKSNRIGDIGDLIFIIIASIGFISFGIYGDFWVGYVIGVVFALAPFMERIVSIYENGLRVKRNLFFYKKEFFIPIEDCKIFKNNNGPYGWKRYAIQYMEHKKVKKISFYISDYEDLKKLINFFESKGVKVSIKFN